MPSENESSDPKPSGSQLLDQLEAVLHPAKRILGFILVAALLGVLILISLSYFAPNIPIWMADYGFWLTRPTTTAIVTAMGINVWTARVIAIIFDALVIYSLSAPLRRLSPHYFFLTRRGRIILVSLWCVACIAMSVRSENVFFTQDGKPAQKYYQGPDGSIEYFPLEMNVNPSNGEPLRLVTTELRKKEELIDRGYKEVRVVSSPPNAGVYLNWQFIGNTPLQIVRTDIHGILVIALNGYSPQYKDISSVNSDSVTFDLKEDFPISSKKYLLIVREGSTDHGLLRILNSEFLDGGLSLVDAQGAREFNQNFENLGGTANLALLAWARAKFGADFLVITTADESERELGKSDVGYSAIQKSLQGIYRVETTAATQVINTHTGELLFSFDSHATSTSVDKLASASESLSKVSKGIANRIRRETM